MESDGVMVGDVVLVRATVLKVQPGVGLVVELFSKTDQYQAWITEDLIESRLLTVDLPPEPDDGTWVPGLVDADTGTGSVFRRDDVEGHSDTNAGLASRRYDRRWWDYAAGEWIDWPTAFGRGADPAHRLVAVSGPLHGTGEVQS